MTKQQRLITLLLISLFELAGCVANINKPPARTITYSEDFYVPSSSGDLKQSLKQPLKVPEKYRFFNLLNDSELSERIVIDHQTGLITFQMLKGTLEDNINSLITNTEGASRIALLWHGGDQRVYSDHWATGHSMFELMNNILKPYTQPAQLVLGIYEGSTLSVYYQTQGNPAHHE
jgi:hypothetical protein